MSDPKVATSPEPPKRDPVRYRKILCPVDFSESSRAALDTAVALARSQDAPLTLLHVYNVPMNLPDGYFDPEIFQIIGTATDKLLAEWKLLAEAGGAAHVDTASMPGTAWDGVVATARQGRFDLIVLGTHGRTGLKHVLLGSVAERVVQHAPCTVLVVRPTTW